MLSYNLYMAEAEGVLPPSGERKRIIDEVVDELVTFARGGADIDSAEVQDAAFTAHNISSADLTTSEINYLKKQVFNRLRR